MQGYPIAMTIGNDRLYTFARGDVTSNTQGFLTEFSLTNISSNTSMVAKIFNTSQSAWCTASDTPYLFTHQTNLMLIIAKYVRKWK